MRLSVLILLLGLIMQQPRCTRRTCHRYLCRYEAQEHRGSSRNHYTQCRKCYCSYEEQLLQSRNLPCYKWCRKHQTSLFFVRDPFPLCDESHIFAHRHFFKIPNGAIFCHPTKEFELIFALNSCGNCRGGNCFAVRYLNSGNFTSANDAKVTVLGPKKITTPMQAAVNVSTTMVAMKNIFFTEIFLFGNCMS